MAIRFSASLMLALLITSLALADGKLEEARKQFFDVTQKEYVETVKNLESGDTKAAEVSAKRLHDQLDALENPMLYIQKELPNCPELKSRWESVMKLFGNVRTSTGLLEAKIGSGDTSFELSTLKTYFEKFGDEFNKAYDDFKKMGKSFYSICETCR
jgi:hypothetical protein